MQEDFQLFRLDTLSGVQPGTRTQTLQRLRLVSQQGDCAGDAGPRWAILLWYSDPSRWVLSLWQPDQGRWAQTPLLELGEPLGRRDLVQRLSDGLEAVGWQVRSCGTCAFWRRHSDSESPEGLPLGCCGWEAGQDTPPAVPDWLAGQSALALGCEQWSASLEDQNMRSRIPAPPRPADPPEQKQPGLWRRAWQHFTAKPESDRSQQNWMADLEERSGVGAGTDPCLACQGRIANLGALVVATAEGDKRTFSLWRCRNCQTLFLNDWIDRWVRLDSLQTEERFFRLAPMEALEVLAAITAVGGGEHPAGANERGRQLAWFERWLAGRKSLSHQVRRG